MLVISFLSFRLCFAAPPPPLRGGRGQGAGGVLGILAAKEVQLEVLFRIIGTAKEYSAEVLF